MILGDNNNIKDAPPPADPPPPPPADVADLDLGDSMDSQPDFSFNLELTRNQVEQYGSQFEGQETVAPAVTIVGKFAWNKRIFTPLLTAAALI